MILIVDLIINRSARHIVVRYPEAAVRTYLEILAASLLLLDFQTAAAAPQTFVKIISQPGEPIGYGKTFTLTSSNGTFSISGDSHNVDLRFSGTEHNFDFPFSSPANLPLTVGDYEGAQRSDGNQWPVPGMNVGGDSLGCADVTGRFVVLELERAADQSIKSLAIDFEQHCEGQAAALIGVLRYHSTVSAVPRLEIGHYLVRKPNAGSVTSNVAISLLPPATVPVSVRFATSDGTGIAGRDYVSTTGSVTIPAGATSIGVRVPVLGSSAPAGDKIFKVTLSNPVGALVGSEAGGVHIQDGSAQLTLVALDTIGNFNNAIPLSLSSRDAGFVVYPSSNAIEIDAEDQYAGIMAQFSAPTGQNLLPGLYKNAQPSYYNTPYPGLDITGDGNGCNYGIEGGFYVEEARLEADAAKTTFLASFRLHCDGVNPELVGTIANNAKIRQLSLSDAAVVGGLATFTATLNRGASTAIKVTFQTGDGTAIAGRDYVPTTQTLTFAPGQLSQSVSVPLLRPTTPNLEFFGSLIHGGTTPIWVGRALADF